MSAFFRAAVQKMAGYVPGEQPQTSPGEPLQASKIIKLNTNENPYPPSPAVARAIEAVLQSEHGLSRYPDAMANAFRIRAAEILGVEPDWILCGNGSDDLLTIVTRAFVGEGQLLRLPYPSYVLYKTLATIQGASAEEVHFQPDWSLGTDFSAASDDLRCVFLPNPNSPSGTMVPRETILDIAARLPCPLLVDEAYVDFADTNCVDLVKRNEKIIVTRSMSKSYGLAGLRFGFAVAQPPLIEQLTKVKDSYNCDALAVAGATAAIDDQLWLSENQAKIIATRERLTRAMDELGFSAQPSQANFVWCTHAERPVKPLYEQLKASHILIRYMNYPYWGDGLRVSVGTDGQIDAFLSVLKSAL